MTQNKSFHFTLLDIKNDFWSAAAGFPSLKLGTMDSTNYFQFFSPKYLYLATLNKDSCTHMLYFEVVQFPKGHAYI